MDDVDKDLVRAWLLCLEDPADEIYAELEQLLPGLLEAGYAAAEPHKWWFTPKGVARANELVPDDDPGVIGSGVIP